LYVNLEKSLKTQMVKN